MQAAGVLKPPGGSETKSRQTHIFWQQKAPTVVGTMQTKPFSQRLSLESFLGPVMPPRQSSLVAQLDVQSAPVPRKVTSTWSEGNRQTPDAHPGAGLRMTLTPPGPAGMLTPMSQGAPKIGDRKLPALAPASSSHPWPTTPDVHTAHSMVAFAAVVGAPASVISGRWQPAASVDSDQQGAAPPLSLQAGRLWLMTPPRPFEVWRSAVHRG